MKIAIFSDTFYPQVNGVVSAVRQSAEALAGLGHDVLVVTASELAADAIEAACGSKFKVATVWSAPFWGYSGERLSLPAGWSLKAVRAFRPDIIHSHTPFAVGIEAVLAAKMLDVPIVGTHHTFYDHYLEHIRLDFDWMKRFSWRVCVAYYNRVDLVLNPSSALDASLVENGLKVPTRVVHNPIDTGMFSPVADSQARDGLKARFGLPSLSLVYMGRLSYEKSIDQVIRAFASAKKSAPSLKLLIVGDGPERPALESLAGESGLVGDVVFAGLLRGPELVEAIQANDIFITASKSENMPISVLEGMACGLPVIGVRANGMPEIVEDGKNGLLADPDNIGQLAACILASVNDQEFRLRAGRAARDKALEFSQAKFAQSLIAHYKSLLKK